MTMTVRRAMPVAALMVAVLAGCGSGTDRQVTASGHMSALAYGRLPLAFEPNLGQVDPRARFVARGPGYAIFLTRAGALTVLSGGRSARRGARSVSSIRLLGANPHLALDGRQPLPERVNSYIGADPARWRTGIPTFGAVRYRSVWPGIDALLNDQHGQLGFDFVLAPGARPGEIALSLSGAGGQPRLRPPQAFQVISGGRVPVPARYRTGREGRISLQVGHYDPSRRLIVDPAVMFSTYLGGRGVDQAGGIAVDPTDHAFVTGTTASANFPTVHALQRRPGGGHSDSFVAQLSPTGNGLVYATFLGGRGDEDGTGITIDSLGDAYVTGDTTSRDFPLRRAVQTASGGGMDAYVAKLDPTGRLVYSTYLGGSGEDGGAGIAVDQKGSAYVTGSTVSADFPTTSNAFQRQFGGGGPNGDAFAAKITFVPHACEASRIFTVQAPPFNGMGFEGPKPVTVPIRARIITTLITDGATGLPPPANPWTGVTWKVSYEGRMRRGVDPNYRADGYEVVLEFTGSQNPNQPMGPDQKWRYDVIYQLPGGCPAGARNVSGNDLEYSTYLGGSGDDAGNGIAVNRSGEAYVAGVTSSHDFPTKDALQSALKGGPQGQNAFVTKLDRTGGGLVYSTYLGGSGFAEPSGRHLGDGANAIAVDTGGNAYVTGSTASSNFPLAHAQQPRPAGGAADDAFVSKLDSAGTRLEYSTYLGGTDHDRGLGIAADSSGDAFVTGQTSSRDFPIRAAPQPAYGGGDDDAFITEYNPSGERLVYSTYLGGKALDIAFGIAVDYAGDAFVTGGTASPDFPTDSALRATLGGKADGFVTELPAGGAAGPGPAVLVPGFLFNKICPVWYFPNPTPKAGGLLKITLNCNSQGSIKTTGYVIIGTASCPSLQCVQGHAQLALALRSGRPKRVQLRSARARVRLGHPGAVTIRLTSSVRRQIATARRHHRAVLLVVLARFTAPHGIRSRPFSLRLAHLG